MANQTNIPYMQTQNMALNQTQQNVNKVNNNNNNKIVSLQDQVAQMMILGEIKFAPFTLAQFQAQAGTDWILANGQSCIGTDYSKTYSQNTVPTISVPGTNAFIKVN
jgi:hypothetical protein